MENGWNKHVFKDYPAERLMIDSIRSRLDAGENALRDEIMNAIINSGGPVSVIDLQLNGEKPGQQRREQYAGLLAKKVIVLDGDEEHICFVYPVSALPTPHKVNLADGRSFYAMCAVDSLGAAFTFNQDTSVQSMCAECGAPVLAKVRDGKLQEVQPESLFVLHVDLSSANNWAGGC